MSNWKYFALAALGVLAIQIVIGIIITFCFNSWTDRGTFGDMFGAVNTLFSGLAFAGVILAIILQKQELALQRDELKLTREEITGQKEQLQAQNITFQAQKFENTFFNMIKSLNELASSMTENHGGNLISGEIYFRNLYNKVVQEKYKPLTNNTSDVYLQVSSLFKDFKSPEFDDPYPYFRQILNTLKLIDNSQVDNKSFYSTILRDQLSSFELLLLFYYTACTDEAVDNSNLMEIYTFFKHLPLDELPGGNHKDFYEQPAYR